jgi:hypothetical protein
MASLCLPLRDSHPLRSPVPAAFGFTQACHDGSTTPSNHLVQPHPSSGGSLIRWCGLGSSRFARRYYGNPICSSGYMRCFSSPGSLLRERRSLVSPRGVAPFGHLRIAGCQRLPRAFRRVATSFIGLLRLGIHHVPICGSSCSWFLATSQVAPGRGVRGARDDVRHHTRAGPSQWRRLFILQCAPIMVEPRGFEPRTSALQRRRSPG